MRVLVIVAALALGGCADRYRGAADWVAAQPVPKPHPNSIAAQVAGEWAHEPAVRADKLEQDKAHCKTVAAMAPPGAGTAEIKFDVTYLNCLKAMGYRPIPAR